MKIYKRYTLNINSLNVLILRKKVKNINLAVLPSKGEVRVSAPLTVSDEVIKRFIIKKHSWILKHLGSLENQKKQTEHEYVSGEKHFLRGKEYLLKIYNAQRPNIEVVNEEYIFFYVHGNYSTKQRKNYYENWLRKEMKKDLELLIPKWEKITGLKPKEVRIKKMKTRWGTCNPKAKRIWLNLELIKNSTECLEYVILHELAHFIERYHNKNFKKILDKYMPDWRTIKDKLNKSAP